MKAKVRDQHAGRPFPQRALRLPHLCVYNTERWNGSAEEAFRLFLLCRHRSELVVFLTPLASVRDERSRVEISGERWDEMRRYTASY